MAWFLNGSACAPASCCGERTAFHKLYTWKAFLRYESSDAHEGYFVERNSLHTHRMYTVSRLNGNVDAFVVHKAVQTVVRICYICKVHHRCGLWRASAMCTVEWIVYHRSHRQRVFLLCGSAGADAVCSAERNIPDIYHIGMASLQRESVCARARCCSGRSYVHRDHMRMVSHLYGCTGVSGECRAEWRLSSRSHSDTASHQCAYACAESLSCVVRRSHHTSRRRMALVPAAFPFFPIEAEKDKAI